MPAPIAEGEVALLLVRVRCIYRDTGMATVRIATPGSAGGPGFSQQTVPLTALTGAHPDPENPDKVPRYSWR